MIQAGAAGLVASLARPTVAATVAPFQPKIDPRVKARALLALEAKRSSVPYRDLIGIADFSRPSRETRFYILDLASGQITTHLVAHGRGSDPTHIGWLQSFSNDYGSEATSKGAYLTGEPYHGKYGYSMRLKGLDHSNNNAEARAIVVHSAWYAEPKVIEEHGKLGRSEGCFALPGVSHAEVMLRLGPGRLLYADKVG
jgi:hypothetical protein